MIIRRNIRVPNRHLACKLPVIRHPAFEPRVSLLAISDILSPLTCIYCIYMKMKI